MTQIKKRATALLLGIVTFFIALAMPYNTTRVYASDLVFSWVVNESSNTILNWILLYLGISVAPEAISEGKVFDKTGEFALDFCKEFFGDTFEQWYVSNGFGDDVDTFKKAFNDILTQDYDAAKYVAGDIKSNILEVLYKYFCDEVPYYQQLNNYDFDNLPFLSSPFDYYLRFGSMVKGEPFYNTKYSLDDVNLSCDTSVHPLMLLLQSEANSKKYRFVRVEFSTSRYYSNGTSSFKSKYLVNGLYYSFYSYGVIDLSKGIFDTTYPYFALSYDALSSYSKDLKTMIYELCSSLINGTFNLDLPLTGVSDYAYDLVGTPWTLENDTGEKVKPWEDVDSLPIPGDVVIGDSFPGVIDLPGIDTGLIDGTIPWPDIIQKVKEIDIPDPDPDPDEPDKKPEPEPELPEIPAVLPQGVSDKLKDLSGKFPFCIPFDLVDCYKSFATKDNAEAPKWDIDFTIPGTNQEYHFSVDLAMFDKYIPIFRSGVLILFFIGLLLATRKLIGWQIDN